MANHVPVTDFAPATRPEHPQATAERLPPARSLWVYSADEAEKLYPWWTPATAEAKLVQLAQQARSRTHSGFPLVIVYAPDGSLFGVVPVAGRLHGIILPPLTSKAAGHNALAQRAAAVLATPTGQIAFRSAVFALAGRLAVVETEPALTRELTAFRPHQPRPSIISLKITHSPVLGTPSGHIQTIIGRLLATYQDDSCEHIQARGRVRPPQRAEVQRVIDGFFPLLFPGYHGPLPADPGFNSFVCRRVSALQNRLARLVRQALAFRDSVRAPGAPPPAAYRAETDRAVVEFFDALPEIRRTLDADVEAAYRNDPALPKGDHHSVPLGYPGLRAVASYRLAHQLHVTEIPYLPRMITELAHSHTGIDIHPGARIGKGFFIDHGTGVVIGETAIIGEQVTLYQGVTLGALNFEWDEAGNLIRGGKRHPTIHNRTTIYANAAVLGDIEVGHGTRVGANVSLRQRVDPESVVRVPFSLRELSITSPKLALEKPVEEPARASASDPAAPADLDPESGLPVDWLGFVANPADTEEPRHSAP
jgi:serine O-acetyltransferase